jgi:hypothetical protein
MVWGKAGSTTLSSAGDLITVDSLPNNKSIMILNNVFSSGTGKLESKLNNDSGSNYAIRYSIDGAAEVTITSAVDFENTSGGFTNGLMFHVQYLVNIPTEEKLLISQSCEIETTGAGTAPRKRQYVGKWTNTSDAVSRYDVPNVQSGDFTADSNSTVLGNDITPASAITFPTNVQVGSRAEITDTRKMYNLIEEKYEDDLSTDKGWVSSYSTKMAYNGTTDKLDLSFENELNNANITIVKELDFTLGTKFVVRFVLDFSQFGGLPFMTMGVSDKDSTVNADTAQDYLGIVCHNGTTWSAQVKDNTELGTFTNINQASYSGHQSGFGTDFYCELIRNGNSFTINIRTGSHTGTSVVTATTTISTIGTVSNLKYIKFGNYDGTSTGGYCTTTIDDLSVYNGVISPSSTPSKSWKEIGV